MSQMYTQCILKREINESTSANDTVWIPAHLAKVGKTLQVKDADGEWTDGWVVTFKGSTRSEEYLRTHERDHVHQREASDI